MKRPRKFDWRQFGRDLRAHRTAYGWGLREAARETETHHATFCRAEHGKRIEVADFVHLCWWIGTHPFDYLPKTKIRTSP